MFKNQSNSLHKMILPCVVAYLAMIATGCLEDHWEPDDEVDTSGLEECDSPEEWRCNGEVIELCRLANGHMAWRPMEDCSNIAGGFCEDPGDGTPPFCTGNYWDSGYCPGSGKPAASDCGDITDVGCCNEAQQNLWCGSDGILYCVPCWSDSYYMEFCTWDEYYESYGCMYLENGEDDIMEDPSGTTPLLCGDAEPDGGTDL